MTIITVALLVGDAVYRVLAIPQGIFDLFIVMGGVALCNTVILLKSGEKMQLFARGIRYAVLGGVLGAVVGLGSLILYNYAMGNPLAWGNYLSKLLGASLAFMLALVIAHVISRRDG